jgi:4-amino-4-deoxy-L-arabinose transferase-like glycosyltransferase
MSTARRSLALRALLALAVAGVAFGLRWRAIEILPVDYDEGWYLEAAQRIARVLEARDFGALTAVSNNYRPEHPQLAKLVYGVAILPAHDRTPTTRSSVWGKRPQIPEAQLVAARTSAALFGALAAGLLALLQPLAGLLLAIHTYTVKYTSLVMLEALPAFTSLAAVVCYVRGSETQRAGWWAASSALLGLTAAAKYMYAVIGVAILADWLLALRREPASWPARLRAPLLWGIGSLLVFYAAYPYLWPDPVWRLRESIFFHADYSTSVSVTSMAYPFWQPLAWLTNYIPADVPQARPYLFRVDPLITLLALVGFDRLWRRQRVYALWLAIALVFLLLWNTKWPHYVLLLTAPLCLAAAEGALRLAALPLRRWRRRPAGA